VYSPAERKRKLCVIATHAVKLCKLFAIPIRVNDGAVRSVFSTTSDIHLFEMWSPFTTMLLNLCTQVSINLS